MRRAFKKEAGAVQAPAAAWLPWAWRGVAVVAGLFILGVTVPWKPAEEAPIGAFDFSWMLLVHDAVATGRQFGPQIDLVLGPTGFLGNSVYDPRTYPVLVAARSLIALAALAALWEAARKFIAHPLAAVPWLLVIVALIGRSTDHFFPALAVLLLASYFAVHDRKVTAAALGLVAALGVVSLVKVNQSLCALVAIGAVSFDQLRRRGRRAWLVPATYAVALAGSYLAARQSPSSLVPFLRGWYQATAGHMNGMHLPGALIDALAYLLVAALVVALIGVYAWRRWRWNGATLVAGTGGILLMLYKHSFVRPDLTHAHIGPLVALATGILYAPLLWPLAGPVMRGAIAVMIGLAATLATSILSSYTPQGLPGYAVEVADRFAGNLSAAASLLIDPGRLRREWEAARRKLRDDNFLPLAKIHGTVNVYPHRQDVVFAYALDYQPRPVVSSVMATSPELAEANARHLRAAGAPQTVLFDVEGVDHNFPTMLDGASLPELLTRYDVIDASGAMLVLARAAAPRPYHFERLPPLAARFDEPIPVPDAQAAPIWVHVRFRPRIAGRLLSALYKPPTLGIVVHTRDGVDHGYRLLPTLADQQGFLLSPLIEERSAYARLAARSWSHDLSAARVDAMTISVDDGSQDASFHPDFTVEFQRLEFQRE